jgi:hypothetical protein
MESIQTEYTKIKIDFGPEMTSDAHFFNTGVRFFNTYVVLKENGNTWFGNRAHRAFYALPARYRTGMPDLEVQLEFIIQWKKNNPQ